MKDLRAFLQMHGTDCVLLFTDMFKAGWRRFKKPCLAGAPTHFNLGIMSTNGKEDQLFKTNTKSTDPPVYN